MNTKKSIFAMAIDAPAIPVNPRTPAIRPTTRNMRAQRNKRSASDQLFPIKTPKARRKFRTWLACRAIVTADPNSGELDNVRRAVCQTKQNSFRGLPIF